MSIVVLIVTLLLAGPSAALAAADGPLLASPSGDEDHAKTAPLAPIELGGSCDNLDPQRRPAMLIKNARVIDGTGQPAQERVSILVQDGKIAMVGQGLSMRSDRQTAILDATGLTVLPGLIDVNADFSSAGDGDTLAQEERNGKRLRAYLASGVTTVMDSHASSDAALDVRKALAGGTPGPRYLTAATAKPAPSTDLTASTVRVKLTSGGETAGARQLELPTKAVSSPVDAIHQMTQAPADALGVGELVGTIAVGKRADLVLVRGDPSKDLIVLRDVVWTVREGIARTPDQWMQAGGVTAGGAPPSANPGVAGVAP